MLSNAYFLAKFRFDTSENEPAQNLQKFCKICPFFTAKTSPTTARQLASESARQLAATGGERRPWRCFRNRFSLEGGRSSMLRLFAIGEPLPGSSPLTVFISILTSALKFRGSRAVFFPFFPDRTATDQAGTLHQCRMEQLSGCEGLSRIIIIEDYHGLSISFRALSRYAGLFFFFWCVFEEE